MTPLTNAYGIPSLNFDISILTQRELEVVERVLLPGKNIASSLGISENTVNVHLTNIKTKTGLLDKYQMAYYLGTKKGAIN